MGATDIGARIGIEGEKQFRDSIKAVNAEIKSLGSLMRSVTARFDENENGMEALTSQSEILGRSIAAAEKKLGLLTGQAGRQREKLEELAQALEQAKKEYGENSVEAGRAQNAYNRQAAAVNNLEAQINDTTASIRQMENQVRENQEAVENFGREVDETSDSMESAEKVAFSFGDALKASIVSDVIVGALNFIKDGVKELGKALFDFSGESESAAKKAAAYFGETGEAAEETARIISDVYAEGFGDSMDQVSESLMAVKKNLKDLPSDGLMDITKQAMTLDELFGVDMDETLRGVNSLMTQFGLDAQTAMDYIVAGTQNGLDKTNELGDNIAEYAGKFSQAGYSAEEYFQLLQNGLDGGAYNLDKVNDAINEVTTRLSDGTVEDALDSFSQETRETFSEWKKGGATQKEVINEIIRDIAEAESQQEALTMAAAAFGTMGEDFNLGFIESLRSVGDAYTDVKGRAGELLEATTTSQQVIDSSFREMQTALQPVGDTLRDMAASVMPRLAESVTGVLDGTMSLKDALMNIGSAGAEVVTGIVAGIMENLPLLGGTAGELVGEFKTYLAQNLPSLISSGLDGLLSFSAGLRENVGCLTDNAIEMIMTLADGLIASLPDLLAKVPEIVINIAGCINDNAPKLLAAAATLIAKLILGLIQNIPEIVRNIPKIIQAIASTTMAFNWLSLGGKVMTGVGNGIRNMAGSLKGAVTNGFSGAIDYVKSLPKQFLSWGKDMVSGLIDGIRSMIGNVGKACKDLAGSIAAYIHFSKPDIGPLSDFDTYMPDMGRMLSKGILDQIPQIARAMDRLSSVMVPEYSNGTAAAYDRMAESLNNLQIVLDDGTLVGKTAPKMDRAMGRYAGWKERYNV